MSRTLLPWCSMLILLMLAAAPAQALTIEPARRDEAGNLDVLWIRDCGNLDRDRTEHRQCKTPETRFSPGDSVNLSSVLAARERSGKKPYDEIWLDSGGGSLDEGLLVGQVLRSYQATVRVPAGASCVSACTVAFLGGLFRTVDERATYEVHSASTLLNGFRSEAQIRTRNRLLSDRKADVEDELRRFAENQQRGTPRGCDYPINSRSYIEVNDNCDLGARGWAKVLFTFFQQALLPLGRNVDNSSHLKRWFQNEVPAIPYVTDPKVSEDAERIRLEGEPTAQEILMRIERDSMNQAIEELRRLLPELGPRADAALKMLEAMYSSRITGTASLSQETLLAMGYTTKFFQQK